MTDRTTTLSIPGHRVRLSTHGRAGYVTLPISASKAMGHHEDPGYDGGEPVRRLRATLEREVTRVAREYGLDCVEISASKRGCQPWVADVRCFEHD